MGLQAVSQELGGDEGMCVRVCVRENARASFICGKILGLIQT